MLETGKIAVAPVMIRAKFSLCCLRVFNNLLLMATMFCPDEVRPAEALSGQIKEPSPPPQRDHHGQQPDREFVRPFQPEKYTNEYRAALMELIQAKIAGRKWRFPPPSETAKVVDLMEAFESQFAGDRRRQNAGVATRSAPPGENGRRRPDEDSRRKSAPCWPWPPEPFDSPAYLFELKWDGLRALALSTAAPVCKQEPAGDLRPIPGTGLLAPAGEETRDHLDGRLSP